MKTKKLTVEQERQLLLKVVQAERDATGAHIERLSVEINRLEAAAIVAALPPMSPTQWEACNASIRLWAKTFSVQIADVKRMTTLNGVPLAEVAERLADRISVLEGTATPLKAEQVAAPRPRARRR